MGLHPYCGFNAHTGRRCGGTAGSARFASRQGTDVGELGDELVGDLAGDRPAAIGFELADGGTCLRTDVAIELSGAVAESSKARLDLPDPLLALISGDGVGVLTGGNQFGGEANMIEELLVSLAVRRQPVAALIFGNRPAGAVTCNAIAPAVKYSQRGKLALHRGNEGIALALRFAD